MKTQNRYFWIGLLIYAVSFFLVALGATKSSPGNQPLLGFACAYMALLDPLLEAKQALLDNVPLLFGPGFYLSLVISGWINPIFLLTAFLLLSGLYPRAVRVLRIVIVSMIPFCWVFAFYYIRTYPREGHFLWIAGMLLVLFSDKIPTSHGS